MASGERSPLEKTLGIFCDVRPGEGLKLLLLACNLCGILFAYYLLKTIREPLILAAAGGGAEAKSYASAAQACTLIGVSLAFGALARRFDRVKLITIVTLFFAANLVVFFLLHAAMPQRQLLLGVAFFIWVGCFSLMMIAQFWSFANDLYDKEAGQRLFAFIAAGSAIGAIAGAHVAKPLFERFGAYPMMLISAAIISGCLVFTWWINKLDVKPIAAREADAPVASHANGFSLLVHDKYLLCVGALSVMKNLINTTGEYILDRQLLEVAHDKVGMDHHAVSQFIGAFKSDYFSYVNTLVLVMQLFAVSRIIKYLGVRKALFILPMLTLCTYTSMAIVPALMVIFVGKIAENTTDYSLQKTLEQTFFLITSRDAKYKVKAVVDTFLVRSGDVLSAGFVWLGAFFHVGTIGFILLNIVAIVLYSLVLIALVREQKKRSDEIVTQEAAPPVLRAQPA